MGENDELSSSWASSMAFGRWYGPYGEQIAQGQKVLQMKRWNGRWMFKIKATDFELCLEGLCRTGLVDDVVEILHESGGDAHVLA